MRAVINHVAARLALAMVALVAMCGQAALVERGLADTYYVDQGHAEASDANAGTADAPFLTINAAARRAGAGDTVLVRPGHYRESVEIVASGRPDAPIVFRSEQRHGAVISGSDIIDEWHANGPGVWYTPMPEIGEVDSAGGNAEWIYVEGFPLLRAEERGKLLPGTFYHDFDSGRLYVAPAEGEDIHDLTVEFAHRQGLIVANGPRDHITITGFKLTHDGSPERGTHALHAWGSHWLIEDNLFTWTSSRAIHVRNSVGVRVRNNSIKWSGQLALGMTGVFVDGVVEGNTIKYSNWRRFSPAWEAGATKFVSTFDSVFRDNHFAYAYGPGLWFDGRCSSNLMVNNLSHDNIGAGFFTEIDFPGQIFRDNVSYNNVHGITIAETPGALVRQNVVFNNELGIRMRGGFTRTVGAHGEVGPSEGRLENLRALGVDERRIEQWAAQHVIAWNAPEALMSNNTAIWENLIFDNATNYFEQRNYAERSSTDPFVNNFSDHNIWYAAAPERYFRHNRGHYDSLEHWREVSGRDTRSMVVDPHNETDSLPEWARSHSHHWQERFRSPEQMRDLSLRLVRSPQAAIAMARIRRAEEVTELSLSDGDMKAYVFDHEGERVLTVWNTQAFGRKYLRLNVGKDRIVKENAYKHREPVELAEQALDLAVTWEPVYLRGVGEQIEEVESGILRARLFNAPGDEIPVTALFRNTDHTHQEALRLGFTASDGFEVRPARVSQTLGPAESARVEVRLVPDGSVARGSGTVRMTGTFGVQDIERVAAFVVGEGAGTIPRVAAGQIEINGEIDDWGEILDAPPLGVINTIEQMSSGDEDGWGGPEALSAWIYAAWSEEALYLAARVADDRVVPAPPGAYPWSYDAVEFFIDGRSPEMQWQSQPTPGCYQIGVSPAVGDTPANVRVFDQNRQLEGLETATSLTDDGYIVEVRIPLTEANFPAGQWESGRPIQLGVLVNDRDTAEGGRDRVFFWGEGAGEFFNDTSLWTTLTLEE